MEETNINQKKVWNRLGFSLVIMAVSIMVVGRIIDELVDRYLPQIYTTEWYRWVVYAVTFVGVGLPVFYFMLKLVPDFESQKDRVKVKLSLASFFCIFFICAATMYLSNFFGYFINFLITLITGKVITNPVEELVMGSNLFLMFINGTIIAPIVEEVVFRKLLLDKVRRYGDVTAILVTGFAFGLFHMNLPQFFYATTIGFIFAYITLRTNTIKYAIILHMMINFIGSTIAPYVVVSGNIALVMLVGVWGLTAIALGTTLFFINIKKISFEKAEVKLEKKSMVVLNFGVVIFILLCLYSMVSHIYQ